MQRGIVEVRRRRGKSNQEVHAMSDSPDPRDVASRSRPPRRRARAGVPAGTPETFRAEFNEPLDRVLNLGTWRTGIVPVQEYQRIDEEVRRAVANETEQQRYIRAE